MKSIRYFSILILLVLSISSVNAQTSTKTINGIYVGMNDDYNYVFKLDDGTKMEFNEVTDDIVDILTDENINKKYKVTYEEEIITDDEENGEETDAVSTSGYVYRKIIGLKEI